MQQPEITLQSFYEAFEKFAAQMMAKFADTDKRFNTIDARFNQLEKDQQDMMEFMRDNLVTHDELHDVITNAITASEQRLTLVIGKTKNEIMDYVDKKDMHYRGELNASLRKEDVKVDQTIIELENVDVFSAEKSRRLQALGPFSQSSARV